MLKQATIAGAMIVCLGPFAARAEAPVLRSGTPVIHLADNLDEKEKLGWCIDTKGRGFAETLHAHSCKPEGPAAKDTQFSHDAESGQIRSVAFEEKCMAFSDPENEVQPFGLLDCVSGEASQEFVHDPRSMEIRIGSDTSKCVVVAPESRPAGPFMSRDLIVAACGAVEKKFKQWIVRK